MKSLLTRSSCVAGCLVWFVLGCGSKQEPVAFDSPEQVPENIAPDGDASGEDNSTLTIDDAPSLTSAAAKLPADDRYAAAQLPNVLQVDVWKGPRPDLPVRSMTLAEFNAAWQVNLEISEQPLAQVIAQITSEVPGWQPQLLVATDKENAASAVVLAGALEKPISLKLSNVSRLEAIERACEAAGVYPEYAHEREFAADSKQIIRLHEGPRSGQFGVPATSSPAKLVAFVGPQMIEINQVKEFPPYGVGNLELRMLSLPLPSPVSSLLAGSACHFDRVLLSDGRDTLAGHAGTTRVIVPTLLNVSYETLQLRGLLQGVTRLSEIQGHVTLPIPLKTSVVWLDSLAVGYAAQTDELTATIRMNLESPGSWALRYEVISGGSIEGLVAFAYDAGGQLIPTESYGTTSAPGFNQGSGSLNLSKQPRMLAVVVVDKLSSFTQEFSLTNVPLTKSAVQPAELPQLDIGQFDQPVTIDAGALQLAGIFKEVELSIANHANKDIREIQVTLHYIDAQGEKKQDSPTLIAANYDDVEEPYPILLKAGATTRLLQSAALCPDETKQVKVTVNSILFSDLDRWPVEAAR